MDKTKLRRRVVGDWLKGRKGANNAVFEEPNEKR